LPDEPLWIWADRVRFVQVASNLVGNAIKFTPPPGSVEVEVIRDGDEALLTVRDSGVGIRSEVLERLFEPFQQDEQGLERSAGGLGLGLSLVRGIVRRHGGQVAVSSGGVGAGTEVRVRWPLADGLPSDEATEPRPSVSSFRVLLVEDNDDLRELLAALLESSGHRVQTTETGVGALELMRSDGADVVICDLGLAGMSGYDVAREVREDPQLQHLPLVALTGYGQPEDRRRSAEAGFDEHLTKPVDIASLNATLARLCSDDTPAHLR
jgi:CheY-like chemotaxis protein